MNCYKQYISYIEDNAHLISMVPVEELLRLGYEIDLNEDSTVLDLCCGYGTLLKVWSEAFGITGVGVDQNEDFLSIGKDRLEKSSISNVAFICDDVTTYKDSKKYDVVICSETFDSIPYTLSIGKKFLKSSGTLCYQKLYSKVEIPPQELIDFDVEVLPLSKLNNIFNQLGFQVTSMASDSVGKWEQYILNWSGKKDLIKLSANKMDENLRNWIKTWYDMYFKYRRQYEGQAMFGLQQIIEHDI